MVESPSVASTVCQSRLPSGSATKLASNAPMLFACAVRLREAKLSSGSEIVIVTSEPSGNPLPDTVTVSGAW